MFSREDVQYDSSEEGLKQEAKPLKWIKSKEFIDRSFAVKELNFYDPQPKSKSILECMTPIWSIEKAMRISMPCSQKKGSGQKKLSKL